MTRRARLPALRAALFAGCVLPVAAHASTQYSRYSDPAGVTSDPPPPVNAPMAGQVNLATGQLGITDTYVTIGNPKQGGMSWVYYAGLTQDNNYGAVNASGTQFTISFGTKSLVFTYSYSNNTFTSNLGNGASLTFNGPTYTLTLRDGTVAHFATQWASNNTTQAVARVTDITSPKGLVTTYAYKAYTFPEGGGTSNAVRLQGVSNTRGYAIKYTYQTSNNSVSDGVVTSVTGINEAVEYCDITADSCSLSNPWPKATIAAAAGGETAVTGPTGLVTTYPVPAASTSQTLTRPTGVTETFAFDSLSRVSSITTAAGTWTYAYSSDGTNQTTTITDPLGHAQSAVTGVATGLVLSQTDGLGHTTSFTYDGDQRPIDTTTADGVKSTNAYDGRGNVVSVVETGTDGSQITRMQAGYDSDCSTGAAKCNLPNWTKDANGNQTDYQYYAQAGLLTAMISPANAAGIRKQMNYYYGSVSAYYYIGGTLQQAPTPIWVFSLSTTCATAQTCDGTANATQAGVRYVTSGAASNLLPYEADFYAGDGSVYTYTPLTYDNIGNLTYVTNARGYQTRYLYDAARNRIGVIGPDPDGGGSLKNRATRYTFTGGRVSLIEQGTTASQSDGDWGNFQSLSQDRKIYDSAGRPLFDSYSTTASGGDYAVTEYQYDAANRLQCTAVRMNPAVFGSLPSACTLSGGGGGPFGQDRITYTQYDAADRPTSVTTGYGTPAARTETQDHTPAGLVAWQADGDNNRTTYFYDAFDRFYALRFPSASQGANASDANNYEAYTFDNDGHVTADRRRDGTTVSYTYDAAGHVTTRTGSEVQGVAYGYDVLGRLTSAAGGGQTLTYAYDALSRLTGQSGPLGSIAMQYDADGNMTRLQWPDGTPVAYAYDAADEMTDITDPYTSLAYYTYDDLGRRSAVYHANAANTAWAACIGYGYGSDLHLSAVNIDGANCATVQSYGYWYNAAGQLRASTSSNAAYDWTPPATVVARPYVTNGLNQYTSSGGVGLSYDGLGDVTNDTRLAYGYDGLGKLLTLSNGAQLSYDPADNLYQTTGSSTTRFLYLGSTIIGEYDGSNNVVARYVPGAATDEAAGWYDHPGAGGYANRRYDLTDRQGSVVAVTDDSGNVLGVNTYDESGNPGANNVGRFQYTGAPWIPEAGLYHMRARDYSTTLGRFLQADPIGYGDGLNFYNYVHGDPVNGWDPSGMDDAYVPPTSCTGTLLCGGGAGFGGVPFLSTSYVNPGCGDCGHWSDPVWTKNVPAGDYTEQGSGRTVTSDGTLSSWVENWVPDNNGSSGATSFTVAQEIFPPSTFFARPPVEIGGPKPIPPELMRPSTQPPANPPSWGAPPPPGEGSPTPMPTTPLGKTIEALRLLLDVIPKLFGSPSIPLAPEPRPSSPAPGPTGPLVA